MSQDARPDHRFDDRNISWAPFRGIVGLHYHLLEVDEGRQQVDMLVKFAAHARSVAHRHVGPSRTLVLEGEHRIYQASAGEGPRQVRAAGAFALFNGDETHAEGAGPGRTIILLSMQAIDGRVWELLDDDLNVTRHVTLADFHRGLERQRRRAA